MTRLPKIYDHFRRGQIFTIDEAREALNTTGNTLRKRLCELSTRGYIVQIRQGMYRLGFPETDFPPVSPFAIASKLTPYCYVGFRTALKFHTSNELPAFGDTTYVVSPTKFNGFEFSGIQYFWCQSPDPYGLESRTLQQEEWEFPLLITNFEKTLIDCLRRPQHGLPLPELVAAVRQYNLRPNLDRFFNYACDERVAALFNKAGYFLDLMRSYWGIPDDYLEGLRSRMTRKQTEWPIGLRTSLQMPLPVGPSSDPEMANRWRIQVIPHGPDGRANIDRPAEQPQSMAAN